MRMLSSVTALISNVYFCFLAVSCLLWFFHSYVGSLHGVTGDNSGLYLTLFHNAVVSHYCSHFLLDLGDLGLFLFPFYSLIPAPLLFESPLGKTLQLSSLREKPRNHPPFHHLLSSVVHLAFLPPVLCLFGFWSHFPLYIRQGLIKISFIHQAGSN